MLEFSSPAIGEFLNLPKNRQISERSSPLKIPTHYAKLKFCRLLFIINQLSILNYAVLCFVRCNPSRGRLYGESPTTCPRFICESRHIISSYDDSTLDSTSGLVVF
jgi:hypothetical protein